MQQQKTEKLYANVLETPSYNNASSSGNKNPMVIKKKNPLIQMYEGGIEKYVHRQASWCQTLILGMDFSILPSS